MIPDLYKFLNKIDMIKTTIYIIRYKTYPN